MNGMDRRTFSKLAFAGLGVSLLPASSARAAFSDAPLPPPLPPPLPGLANRPYTRLLDRARAALDRHQDAFDLRDRVALADFSVASRDHRFHIVDLVGGQVSSYLVAHGRGSDPEHSGWLQSFSNDPGSLATSEGAYKTGEIYDGVHGAAMRLIGLDGTNNNADPRAIVIHAADYVSENHIATWGKLGRSEGCFVVAPHLIAQVLGLLGPGRLLYAAKV